MDGFYDLDIGDELECQLCPCITTTTFKYVCNTISTHAPRNCDNLTLYSTSCQPDVSGNLECFCLIGHEGPLCDSCSQGYFGSPPELQCRSCDCNGNIDPDVPNSCDRETGLCLLCINNSTGPECDVCVDGYYGDATLQDCQPCDCNMEGSVGASCNFTGHCNCLEGVGGMTCDTCLVSYCIDKIELTADNIHV